MRKSLFFVCLTVISFATLAQFPVGHSQITYQDPARSNRNIQTEIYYPGVTSGDNVAVASGQFPIIVFGHGFVMDWDSYDNIWNALVPLGYIMAFPTTEGGFSPDHDAFGKDIVFLINKLKSENTNSASPFYQKITNRSGAMGHSMGGGSSFLACAGNTIPDAMITFAAAVTTPSSVTAAATVTIPTLVISGSEDCTAPPASHQVLMYNALASPCKVYISINGGCHCYFANYNLYCTLGESFCLPVPPLSRAGQQTTTMNFVKPYLDFFLKGNTASWYSFVDSLGLSSNITYINNCPINPTVMNELSQQTIFGIYPNPANDILNVSLPGEIKDVTVQITDLSGRILFSKEIQCSHGTHTNVVIRELKPGMYFATMKQGTATLQTRRFIKE